MFGYTSVNFLLLSIMVFGMVATVICSCGEIVSESCEQPGEKICSCSNHVCCVNPSHSDQCMTSRTCFLITVGAGVSRRRAIQMQERFLRMTRGLAD
uniref:Conotoxin n=1 Tax=Conus praecellens TaxID=128530 RepID=A0A291C2C2_CONPC|nr:conotoxin [Conus praecellens]